MFVTLFLFSFSGEKLPIFHFINEPFFCIPTEQGCSSGVANVKAVGFCRQSKLVGAGFTVKACVKYMYLRCGSHICKVP